MSEIQLVGSFPNVDPAKLVDFKRCITECVETVRAKDPGTLQYDWFFTEDQRTCVLHEKYASSEAMLAHLANVGPFLGKLLELGGEMKADVFGEPSPELLAAGVAFKPVIHKPFITL